MSHTRNKNYVPVMAVVITRIILGAIIFTSVWVAAIGTFLADWIDGEIFKRANYKRNEYQLIDKLLDTYWYTMALVYLSRIHIQSLGIFSIFLFFRLFGLIVYIFRKEEWIFIFFPNFFEILFYAYLITAAVPSLDLFSGPVIYYLIILFSPFVFLREYIIHVKRSNFSGFFTGKTTHWVDEKSPR